MVQLRGGDSRCDGACSRKMCGRPYVKVTSGWCSMSAVARARAPGASRSSASSLTTYSVVMPARAAFIEGSCPLFVRFRMTVTRSSPSATTLGDPLGLVHRGVVDDQKPHIDIALNTRTLRPRRQEAAVAVDRSNHGHPWPILRRRGDTPELPLASDGQSIDSAPRPRPGPVQAEQSSGGSRLIVPGAVNAMRGSV